MGILSGPPKRPDGEAWRPDPNRDLRETRHRDLVASMLGATRGEPARRLWARRTDSGSRPSRRAPPADPCDVHPVPVRIGPSQFADGIPSRSWFQRHPRRSRRACQRQASLFLDCPPEELGDQVWGRGRRCADTKANTSSGTTSAAHDVEDIFRSCAYARTVFSRARTATNSRTRRVR